MRAVGLEKLEDGRPVLVVEERCFVFFKRVRRYLAARHVVTKYYEWMTYPGKEPILNDRLSFTLDSLLEEAQKETKQ